MTATNLTIFSYLSFIFFSPIFSVINLTIFTKNVFLYFYRSDIQYSIDDDTESLHKDADPESRTPIIKPSSRQLSNNSDLKGSENSLLNMTDEDLWLRKGMDEDGSFRQVYIKE